MPGIPALRELRHGDYEIKAGLQYIVKGKGRGEERGERKGREERGKRREKKGNGKEER